MRRMAGREVRAGLAALTTAAALAAGRPLEAQALAYTGGLQYSTSSYVFTETTNSLYLSNGLSWRVGRVELAGSFPLVLQNSAAVSYLAGTAVPTGGPEHGALRGRRGGQRLDLSPTGGYELSAGDPLLRASVDLLASPGSDRSLALDARVKAPVADEESGVGTGEWDFGLGVSGALAAGSVSVFADATYWRYGDFPDLELQDGLAYGLGVGGILGGGAFSLLGSLSGYTEIVEGVDPAVSVGLLGGYRLSRGRFLSLGAAVGLTEAASDFSLLAGWRVGLGGLGGP